VRRLEAQLDGASSREVAVLRQGRVNLALHAVISRNVDSAERGDIVDVVSDCSLRAKELEALFVALGWRALVELGSKYRRQRLLLLAWACATFSESGAGTIADRVGQLAGTLPMRFVDGSLQRAVAR
jgi:hypothetical protein